ncbi:IclR family transcriptional regulator [Geobacter sp.]|uniref:IclR family transcriptional regulator n=1 Tax=Geobacter sp. TaxID=46610 RepID=UPI002629C2ED|nr:IclR family transcriptional regulator [Geobacter sp.]
MLEEDVERTGEATDNNEEEPGKDRQFVTALARGLEVLRCFKPGEQFLGNQEIAKRTDLPKPTVSRLTYTLTQLGFLNYSEVLGKYSLGTGVLSIGNAFLSNMNIRQVARPLMQELADHAHASVALGARDRLEMVYIENCRSSATSFTLNLDVNSRIPIATTAMGRAYICGLPEGQRDHLLDQIKARNEEEWPRIKTHLEQAFRDYQEKGFCLSVGDWQKDVNAVAVPFIPVNGSDVLSFNCGGPAFHIRRHMLEDDIGPRLVALVRNVHAALSRQ